MPRFLSAAVYCRFHLASHSPVPVPKQLPVLLPASPFPHLLLPVPYLLPRVPLPSVLPLPPPPLPSPSLFILAANERPFVIRDNGPNNRARAGARVVTYNARVSTHCSAAAGTRTVSQTVDITTLSILLFQLIQCLLALFGTFLDLVSCYFLL